MQGQLGAQEVSELLTAKTGETKSNTPEKGPACPCPEVKGQPGCACLKQNLSCVRPRGKLAGNPTAPSTRPCSVLGPTQAGRWQTNHTQHSAQPGILKDPGCCCG